MSEQVFFESQSPEPLFPLLSKPCSFMGDLVLLSPSQTLPSQAAARLSSCSLSPILGCFDASALQSSDSSLPLGCLHLFQAPAPLLDGIF